MASGLTKVQKTMVQQAEQLLREAQSEPRFAETMQGQGYDEAAWTNGETLVKALKTAGRTKEKAKASQLGATNTYYHQLDMTWDRGKILAENCITHFQGQTELMQTLGLHRRRKDENGDSWIIRIEKSSPVNEIVFFLRNLYSVDQSQAEMAPVLADHGFPAEILATGAAEVEALVAADNAQENAKAEAARSKQERDEAYMTLKKWVQCARRAAVLARKEMQRSRIAV
jgi:hypothetical protein